jgi:signal transduction histidine kinase
MVEIAAVAQDGDEEAGPDQGGPTVVITVTDNGPGIPPEVTDRIFSPFFTTKPQGSGLGLAIVRKIVDAHDGRIDVGERHGGGAVFRVTLPFRSQAQLFG